MTVVSSEMLDDPNKVIKKFEKDHSEVTELFCVVRHPPPHTHTKNNINPSHSPRDQSRFMTAKVQ